jgi:hypothetical protein
VWRELEPAALERLHGHAIGHFDNRYRRLAAPQLREVAGLLGVQVLHENERHARFCRQVGQQLRKGFQPAGGRADADNRKQVHLHPALRAHFVLRTFDRLDARVHQFGSAPE